jgi:beta-N-acetylhexosaminidase
MTLREKVGQLFMLGFAGTAVSPALRQLLAEYRPAGVILFVRNLEDPEQIARLSNALQEQAPDSPLLIAIDQEGGRVSRLPAAFTIFPPCAVFGICESAKLAYQAAAVTAAELQAVGINMNLAPVLDIHTNEANPIIGDRAFSSAAPTVCELGLATIAGLQDNGVIACGKHFPGHGDTATDSHKELPTVSRTMEQLRDRELKPFAEAIAHGVATLMTAHVLYPALDPQRPATLSATILSTLLREELQFGGVTVTDDLEMQAILGHHGIGEAAVQALQAGADLLLICKEPDRQIAAMEAVYAAVQTGALAPSRLGQSLRRIAALKARFLPSRVPADPVRVKEVVGIPRHRRLVETILETRERLKASV